METTLKFGLGKSVFSIMAILLAILLVDYTAQAQTRTLRGVVTSAEDNQPLPGVTVQVRGATSGTFTDMDGKYSIEVSSRNAVLSFSFVGLETVTEIVGDRNEINVSMRATASQLRDVIVSATRQPITKLETSVAVSVLGREELDKQYAVTIGDAMRFTPGVYVVSQRGRVRTNIIMRGFPENLGSEDKYTTMLIDGLPAFPGSGNAYDQFYTPDFTIENIEIVRGAAATLFGRSAAAGVYNVIPKTGGSTIKGAVQTTIGTNNLYQLDFNLNGPISEKVRFNFGGFVFDDEGIRNQPYNDKGYQLRGNVDFLLKRGNLRVSGAYRNMDMFNVVDVPVDRNMKALPGFNSSFSLWTPLFEGINYSRPTGITDPALGGNPANVESGNVGRDNERGNFAQGGNIGLKFNYDLGNGFSVQNHLRLQQMDLGTKFLAGFSYLNMAAVNVFNSTGRRELRDVVNEFILRKEADLGSSKHLFTLGSYVGAYEQNTRASGFFLGLNLTDPNEIRLATQNPFVPFPLPLPIPGLASTNLLRNSDIDANVVNSSIFLGDEMSFAADKLKINVGWRYDWTNIDVLSYLPKSANGQPGGPQFVSEFVDSRVVQIGAWSATMGANYLIGNNSAVYANFVRAFRAPDEATFAPIVRVPEEPLNAYRGPNTNNPFITNIDQPEIIWNQEIGFRTSAADGDLNIDVAVFSTQINDRIISAFREVAPGQTRATAIPEGSISILGTEMSLSYAPSSIRGLLLRTNLTLQNSEYTDFKNFISDPSNPNAAARTADATGNQVKNVPGTIWNWGAQYEAKLGGKTTGGLGIDGNFMGNRYADELNAIKLADVMLLNGNFFLKNRMQSGNEVRFTVRMNNISNTQKMLWLLDLTPIGTVLRENRQVLPGIPFQPRRTFFSISYHF